MSDAEDRQLGLFGSQPESAPEGDRARPELTADREARRLSQTEFERPLLVEAGAGTGKTTTLTARLLAWSLGPGWERAEARVREREAERHPLAAPSDRVASPDPEAVAAETLSGVVAITFTEAAAAEMARKAGETLARLAEAHLRDGAPPPPWLLADALPAEPERSRRARALLGGLDHLVVRTIHAWCRSLLAAHPLEAGLHPEMEVDADGLLLEEIAREVVEARLAEGYGDPGDDDLLALAESGIGPAPLVEAAVVLVQKGMRADDLEESPFSGERIRRLAAGLAGACEELEAAAGGRLDAVSRSPTTGAALDSLRATVAASGGEVHDLAGFDSLCAGVAEAWSDTRDRLKKWSRGDYGKGETDALGEAGGAAGEVSRAAGALLARIDHLRSLDPARLEHSRRALLPIVREVRRDMRRRGVVTFQDLLSEARDLLVRRPGVAARVRRRIDQLLVDELQDTDRLQCDVIAEIALAGPEGERPGLFLVGDPKQSIYGWRNADLRAYEELWHRVEAAGGRRLTLTENFRSVPAILDEVTASVEPVMIEHPGLQPRFEALVPCGRLENEPGFARGDWRAVEHWVSWLPESGDGPAMAKTRSGDATLVEADAIARDLARLHREEGLPWGEAALLLRAFSQLDDYLDAFRRHGVPFAVTGDRQYYRRREIIDAAALVRTVLDPGDHLALLTLLRSPAVGVPDAALVPLWLEHFPRRMTELERPDEEALADLRGVVERAVARVPAPESVPGLDRVRGWDRVLLATVEALAHLRLSFATDPADRFVEAIRRRVPIEPIAAARYLGRYRLANLERFFRRLAAAIESSEGDIDTVLRALRRGVSEALEEEEGRLQGSPEDAVQVMTIHKAKGLDFGHVYLPQLHKGAPRDEIPWVDAAPRVPARWEGPSPAHLEGGKGIEGMGGDRDGEMEYTLFGVPTPGYAAVAEEAARVAAAERVRTLYVAMTRAEERMVLLGAWPEIPADGARRGPDEATSYLELLGSRFEPLASMTELWHAAEDEGGRLDRHGVRWVFPALAAKTAHPRGGEAEAEPDTARTASTALPSPEEALEAAEQRRALRRSAAARRERKVSAPVSEEAHRRLEALAAARFEKAPFEEEGGVADREAAMASGSVVHRILEELDLTALADDPAAEIARHRERLDALLRPYLPSGEASAEARRRVEEIVERLVARPREGAGLLARLATLRDHVVARELPVLLPPEDEASPDAAPGPVGFVSGALDLLYRDPETGTLVVADYKTDRVESDEDLTARADAYAPQAHLYARAVQQALGLPEPPRAELWFLWPGRVVATDQQ